MQTSSLKPVNIQPHPLPSRIMQVRAVKVSE
jgi:hypothetical protein